jgi:cytidylate kinase
MPIITMSRQMGTGAFQVARDLAKKLKFTLVDGAKIAELAPQYGLTVEMLERVDEKPPVYITAEDRLQAARLNTMELILLDCVKKGNVILYGRGGQDLLVGLRNVLRVRFIAPFEERVERFAEREWIDPDLAREMIRKSDHQRGGFIHYYFDRDWDDSLGYDLVFNTSRLTKSAMVETLIAAARDADLKKADEEAALLLDDIILRKKVETELLKSDKVENLYFRLSCEDGCISVSGHVHSEGEKSHVLKVVASVPGVSDVDDNLQVVAIKSYKE